jgi:hypothetical protein
MKNGIPRNCQSLTVCDTLQYLNPSDLRLPIQQKTEKYTFQDVV